MQPFYFNHYLLRLVFSIATCQLVMPAAHARQPVMPHPVNPHYFLFREKPTVLITSGEHYGAVINPDFDYIIYLNVLQAAGMNLTRAVNGTFCEPPTTTAWVGGDQNTLAPRKGRYLSPFARSNIPGYSFGGNKFDLSKWDEKYFERLKDFVAAAATRNIIVELNLFYVMYGDDDKDYGNWGLSPFNGKNNINGIGNISYDRLMTLDDPRIVERQEAVLRKTLQVLNTFDNVYYEICDEPYMSGASPQETNDWQNRMITVFVETEKNLPKKHMIAVNFDNGYSVIENPHPAITVYNFHYCSPPATVDINYKFNKPIAFDETWGGQFTAQRRMEAWAFMLSGGAVYNNLDVSFATDDPTGSGKVKQKDGIFDSRELRFQLKILRDFMDSLDFIHMKPDRNIAYLLPHHGKHYALVDPGKAYGIYLQAGSEGRTTLKIDLPAGSYRPEWINPGTGTVIQEKILTHRGGGTTIVSPAFTEDIALRLKRVADPVSNK